VVVPLAGVAAPPIVGNWPGGVGVAVSAGAITGTTTPPTIRGVGVWTGTPAGAGAAGTAGAGAPDELLAPGAGTGVAKPGAGGIERGGSAPKFGPG